MLTMNQKLQNITDFAVHLCQVFFFPCLTDCQKQVHETKHCHCCMTLVFKSFEIKSLDLHKFGNRRL